MQTFGLLRDFEYDINFQTYLHIEHMKTEMKSEFIDFINKLRIIVNKKVKMVDRV